MLMLQYFPVARLLHGIAASDHSIKFICHSEITQQNNLGLEKPLCANSSIYYLCQGGYDLTGVSLPVYLSVCY